MEQLQKDRKVFYNMLKVSKSLSEKGMPSKAEEIKKLAQSAYNENIDKTLGNNFSPSSELSQGVPNGPNVAIPSYVHTPLDSQITHKRDLTVTVEVPEDFNDTELISEFYQIGEKLGIKLHDFEWHRITETKK